MRCRKPRAAIAGWFTPAILPGPEGNYSDPRQHQSEARDIAQHHCPGRPHRGRIRRSAVGMPYTETTAMSDLPVTVAAVRNAAAAIAEAIAPSPVIAAPALSEL